MLITAIKNGSPQS